MLLIKVNVESREPASQPKIFLLKYSSAKNRCDAGEGTADGETANGFANSTKKRNPKRADKASLESE